MKITHTALVMMATLGLSIGAYAANDSLANKNNPMVNTTNKSNSDDRSASMNKNARYNSP